MVIKKIEGREDDIFIFNGIKEKEVTVFPDFISRCVIYAKGIRNYKVVQEDKESITIYLDNMNEQIKKQISNEFNTLAERMKFVCPKIRFEKYEFNLARKMKRVERKK